MGRDEETRTRTIGAASSLASELRAKGLRVKVDDREKESPGFKYNYWELRGVPVRVELGPRDLDAGTCVVARRDGAPKENIGLNAAVEVIAALMDEIQQQLFTRAKEFLAANTHRVETWAEFEACFAGEGGGGFVVAHWDGTAETEAAISERTKATIRCIPLTPLAPGDDQPGVCILTGRPSSGRVVFAKAY
jgi:prolyl-tRNA synthetase